MIRYLAREMARRHQISRIERKLLSRVGQSIKDFRMIEDGDRVLVAMSGGKAVRVFGLDESAAR